MKVVLVTGGFPDKENAVKGIFNKKAAEKISKLVDLTVIHYRMLKPGRKFIEYDNDNEYDLIRLSVPQIPFFNKYTISINLKILSYFLKNRVKKYDAIHSVSGLTGVALSFIKNKPKHICQLIGGDINFILPELKKIGFIRNLDGIDEIVCNSNSLRRQFHKNFKNFRNTSVIYRGVDLKKFSLIKKNCKNERVFLYLGGMSDYKHSKYRDNLKGGVTLMEAWSIVDKAINKDDNVELIFGGPNTDDNIKIQKWIKTLMNKDKVKLIGKISPEKVIEFYSKSSVTIIPSLLEGFPNVGMESFAAGSTIIGSDVGGIPELVDDNINGYLFNVGKSEDLAKRILDCVNNTSNFNSLLENAKIKALKKYDDSQFGTKYFNIYNR